MLRLVLGLWLASMAPREEPVPPPLSVELHWSAPDECPGQEAFIRALSEIAGRRLVPSSAAALAVEGRVEASSRGYALELRLRSSTGEELRSLEASDCEALVSAGSLVVVTRLLGAVSPPPEDRPEHDGEAPFAAPADAAVPVPLPSSARPLPPAADAPPSSIEVDDDPVAPPPSPEPSAEPRSPDRPPPRAILAALAGVAVGLGPQPAALVRAGVGLRRGPIRVEAFAMHVFATTTGGGTEPGVRASLTGGGALGCWAPAFGRLEVPMCGGVALGAAVGRGIGPLVATRDVRQLWIGLPLEAGVVWAPIPRLALRALVGGDIGLRRPGIHVNAGRERVLVERPSPVGLHAVGGLELRLP